jgi:hypothetical protein
MTPPTMPSVAVTAPKPHDTPENRTSDLTAASPWFLRVLKGDGIKEWRPELQQDYD